MLTWVASYEDEYPTDKTINEVKQRLGYPLPKMYIDFMKKHNGGVPKQTIYPLGSEDWDDAHIQISSLFSIGKRKANARCGSLGRTFWLTEYNYPNIGIVIADTPSAGHDLLFLDYRQLDSEGEPAVVHVDQEGGFEVTFIASNFAQFIAGLVEEENFFAQFE